MWWLHELAAWAASLTGMDKHLPPSPEVCNTAHKPTFCERAIMAIFRRLSEKNSDPPPPPSRRRARPLARPPRRTRRAWSSGAAAERPEPPRRRRLPTAPSEFPTRQAGRRSAALLPVAAARASVDRPRLVWVDARARWATPPPRAGRRGHVEGEVGGGCGRRRRVLRPRAHRSTPTATGGRWGAQTAARRPVPDRGGALGPNLCRWRPASLPPPARPPTTPTPLLSRPTGLGARARASEASRRPRWGRSGACARTPSHAA